MCVGICVFLYREDQWIPGQVRQPSLPQRPLWSKDLGSICPLSKNKAQNKGYYEFRMREFAC